MTTPLHQAILDAFFTAVSENNANGELPDDFARFIGRYVSNHRARKAEAAKGTGMDASPGERRTAGRIWYADGNTADGQKERARRAFVVG